MASAGEVRGLVLDVAVFLECLPGPAIEARFQFAVDLHLALRELYEHRGVLLEGQAIGR